MICKICSFQFLKRVFSRNIAFRFFKFFHSELTQILLTKVSLTVTLRPLGVVEFFAAVANKKFVDNTGMTSNSATLS